MEIPRLSAVMPLNPLLLLNAEQKRRVDDAFKTGDGFRVRARADIDSRGWGTLDQRAVHKLNQAQLKFATTVIAAKAKALGSLAPNREIFREWIRDEIDGACNSLELHDSQRALLEHEFIDPEPNCLAAGDDPAQPILEAIASRTRDRSVGITKQRNAAYDDARKRSDSNCLGRALWRLQAYEKYALERALLMADVYIEGAKEFRSDNLLTLIRLEHLRRTIQSSIGGEGTSLRDICKQDCHAAGDRPLEERDFSQRIWAAQNVIMGSVYNRLQVALTELAARHATEKQDEYSLGHVTSRSDPPEGRGPRVASRARQRTRGSSRHRENASRRVSRIIRGEDIH